ncbi:hypothetical protein A0257_04595 [Hymenobacter psoromatis]|nr:hypothetical protein A0257_04595 [Hymenobacter psoromatis]
MNPSSIWLQWDLNPAALLLAAGLAAAYYGLAGGRWQPRAGYYASGLALFLLVELSPLHYLGMHALFSAHMVVHIVVLLLSGPLLVLGLPPRPTPKAARWLAAFSRWLGAHVGLAWAAGVGIMWLLHVPAVFDASFEGMHQAFSAWPLLHAGGMLLAGVLFSWPIFGPVPKYRLHPMAGVVYLFTACVGCSLLGLLITFAPADTYQHYARAAWCGTPGLAPDFAANPLGLSLAEDQQAAGLIMWVPCCFIYLTGCLVLVARYFSESEPIEELVSERTELSQMSH